MDEFGALLQWLRASFDKSTLSGWILVGLFAGMWWKGLPGIITAITALMDTYTKRADAESSRLNSEFDRLGRQIEASEQRHGDCERRCEALMVRMDGQERTIAGLRAQLSQLQVSAVRVGVVGPQTVTEHLIAELDKVPGSDGSFIEMKPRR